jgi:hypothetical protein
MRTLRSGRGMSAESANQVAPPCFLGVRPPDPARRASPPDPHPLLALPTTATDQPQQPPHFSRHTKPTQPHPPRRAA